MNPSRARTACLSFLALGVGGGVAAFSLAGPLDPPAGPISPTYKTLTEVEPRTPISSLPCSISQSGSYYLTRNLTSAAGYNGISILVGNVTLDLNGFTLDGNANTASRAVYMEFVSNVTVRNGTIVNWNKEGIDGFASAQVRVENVTVDNSNNGYGIFVGNAGVVARCQVRSSVVGIIAGDGSTVSNCSAISNQRGFQIGNAATITDCTAVYNAGVGFDLAQGANARSCTARANSGTGFQAAASCTIVNCTSSGNTGKGFQMDGAGSLLASTASGNTDIGVDLLPPGGGTSLAARVDGCTITFNGSHGLNQGAGGGSTFTNNTIARNGGAGVRVLDGNHIINNRIVDNGWATSSAGVQALGSWNTIQGNNIINNVGLYNFAAGTVANTFFGNTCSGGTVVNLGTNNIAPLVSASTAFAGGGLSTSNSFVNIQY